jgi:hypothetical protein
MRIDPSFLEEESYDEDYGGALAPKARNITISAVSTILRWNIFKGIRGWDAQRSI